MFGSGVWGKVYGEPSSQFHCSLGSLKPGITVCLIDQKSADRKMDWLLHQIPAIVQDYSFPAVSFFEAGDWTPDTGGTGDTGDNGDTGLKSAIP